MSPRTTLIAAAALVWASATAESLDFTRVHLIDQIGSNWLFRSNMPIETNAAGQTYFAYANLTSYMAQRAQEANLTLPTTFFMAIYSFDNIFEVSDTQYEVDYFKANPSQGSVDFWPLVGQLLAPSQVDNATRQYYEHNNTALWGVDLLPWRLPQMRSMLQTAYPIPRVFVIHCEAGCDRTGEFSAAYYMQYQGYNITGAWDRDVVSCGRNPETLSENAILWYCLTLEVAGYNLGDCINFTPSTA